MSDSRYSYDENAEVWPYFAITLLSLVLLPSTWRATVRSVKTRKASISEISVRYKPRNYALLEKLRKRGRKASVFTLANILLGLGWVLFFAIAYFIYSNDSHEDIVRFDPYEILGVPYSATEKEIKSRYRKLSLKFHPDKVRNILNSTREAMEAQYIDMTKAYKALTDEETRKNYLEYGHPDGPQPMKHGIALPKWLVEEKGSPLVILSYGCIVGVALPFIVWQWWSGTKKYTKNGLDTNTASTIFEFFSQHIHAEITTDMLLRLLSESAEYEVVAPGLTAEEIYMYLNEYINGTESNDELKKLLIASRGVTILEGMLDIGSSFKNVAPVRTVLSLIQAFSQGLAPGTSELCQLPFVTAEIVAASPDMTISDILALEDNEQIKILRLKSNADLAVVQENAKHIPKVEILDVNFKVPGEDIVTPQSLAHLIIKFRVLYSGAKAEPVDIKSLADIETPEILKKPLSTNALAPQMSAVYAPNLPVLLQPKWTVLVVNPREGKIIESPATITRAYTDGAVTTFKIQLSAPIPEQLGQYRFLVELHSNSFLGSDATSSVWLDIQAAPTVEIVEDDISDPEEDSIAGTMALLRGGKVKKMASSDSEKEGDDDDDSSEEEEDSDTDINTDTEDES
ncbi:uncharacterized protein V1518DRAFT_409275 [Limtongia smithiae]|uniref:uncharacterized protein n=1 Tax=Limtongia smithiae TaxID=1125753 RepID=UPI0034CE2BE1